MTSTLLKTMNVAIAAFLLHCPALADTNAVSIDSVVGEVAPGKLAPGVKIEIYLRLAHIPDSPLWSVIESANAFALYSPDAATWAHGVLVDTLVNTFPPSTTYDTTFYGEWIDPQNLGPTTWVHSNNMYSVVQVESFSDHDTNTGTPDLFGEGIDTIRYSGEALPPYSSVPGVIYYDETAWLLLLDSVTTSAIGKTICLDALDQSAPHDYWRWATFWEGNFDTLAPAWDGPHCFEIVADCCEGLRGNINLDLQDTIDISDLTYLVGWMFKSGGGPPCMLEADVDGNGDHDIADVTHLVGYMFKSGAAPAGCP